MYYVCGGLLGSESTTAWLQIFIPIVCRKMHGVAKKKTLRISTNNWISFGFCSFSVWTTTTKELRRYAAKIFQAREVSRTSHLGTRSSGELWPLKEVQNNYTADAFLSIFSADFLKRRGNANSRHFVR